jgi:hypothetical protein
MHTMMPERNAVAITLYQLDSKTRLVELTDGGSVHEAHMKWIPETVSEKIVRYNYFSQLGSGSTSALIYFSPFPVPSFSHSLPVRSSPPTTSTLSKNCGALDTLSVSKAAPPLAIHCS